MSSICEVFSRGAPIAGAVRITGRVRRDAVHARRVGVAVGRYVVGAMCRRATRRRAKCRKARFRTAYHRRPVPRTHTGKRPAALRPHMRSSDVSPVSSAAAGLVRRARPRVRRARGQSASPSRTFDRDTRIRRRSRRARCHTRRAPCRTRRAGCSRTVIRCSHTACRRRTGYRTGCRRSRAQRRCRCRLSEDRPPCG